MLEELLKKMKKLREDTIKPVLDKINEINELLKLSEKKK